MSNGLPFWQIGTEGGFLPLPVQLSQLLLGLAERADVIVDFTNVPVGTEIILQNVAPDEPFGGVLRVSTSRRPTRARPGR
jgi:bilirubin oxidase